MALIERIGSRRVYIDSNIFIYAFENYREYPECGDIMRGLDESELDGVTSEISFIEILPKPVHGGRIDLADAYLRTMTEAAGLALAPVSRNHLASDLAACCREAELARCDSHFDCSRDELRCAADQRSTLAPTAANASDLSASPPELSVGVAGCCLTRVTERAGFL